MLNFWKLISYCSLKPLWSGMGEVVPARTSPILHPPSPPNCASIVVTSTLRVEEYLFDISQLAYKYYYTDALSIWHAAFYLYHACIISLNSYSASHGNWCTGTLVNRTITVQWEGMGDVGSARYEPALLPPCPTIRALSYSNCHRSTHSTSEWIFRNLAL